MRSCCVPQISPCIVSTRWLTHGTTTPQQQQVSANPANAIRWPGAARSCAIFCGWTGTVKGSRSSRSSFRAEGYRQDLRGTSIGTNAHGVSWAGAAQCLKRRDAASLDEGLALLDATLAVISPLGWGFAGDLFERGMVLAAKGSLEEAAAQCEASLADPSQLFTQHYLRDLHAYATAVLLQLASGTRCAGWAPRRPWSCTSSWCRSSTRDGSARNFTFATAPPWRPPA